MRAGADEREAVSLVVGGFCLPVSPLLGVSNRRFERDLEPLPGRVQPAFDRSDRDIEQLGDLDQRMAANVESIQGLAIQRLELPERVVQALGSLAADQLLERLFTRRRRPFRARRSQRSPAPVGELLG